MKIKLNQSALDALGDQIAQRAEDAVDRGIAAAKGQPLAEAVGTVAEEFAKAGLEPICDGIRTKLLELGWEE
jgi:hypothetical protein